MRFGLGRPSGLGGGWFGGGRGGPEGFGVLLDVASGGDGERAFAAFGSLG